MNLIKVPWVDFSGAEIYTSELLLNGIVIQKLEYERLVSLQSNNLCKCLEESYDFNGYMYYRRAQLSDHGHCSKGAGVGRLCSRTF